MDAPLPHHRCPVCGEPNECAPAACGRFDAGCWCAGVKAHPEALQRVPPERIGIACLCRRCLTDPHAAPREAAG
jgi:hypothetical protein